MKLILDAVALDLYPDWPYSDRHGGTETMVKKLAAGLAGIGHTVHVVAYGLHDNEQRGEREFWWTQQAHPTRADCVVLVPSLERIAPYTAPLLVVATNGLGHFLGEGRDVEQVDAWPVFSQVHADLLHQHQGVPLERCFVTGLGIELGDYPRDPSSPVDDVDGCERGRILIGNDPQRGLWHVLDIFDKVKEKVPHATLHITYDVQKVIDSLRWTPSAMAQILLDCEQRIKRDPAITLLGNLSREDLIREQLECQVHVWPSDPPNVGSQIWGGIMQMECAAAGAALVLSDIEATPETFGDAATILPVPGTFVPQAERRVDAQDWADVVAELMLDPEKWSEASRKARAVAEQNTWQAVVDRWERMFEQLAASLAKAA